MSVPPLHYDYVRANDLTFRVATAGEGERLALCLHGFPEFSYSWRHQIPALAKLGYRVWAPDLRGFGMSEGPISWRGYTLKEIARDVDALIEVSGAKSVTLLGHDWGAFIAWYYAMHGGRALEKLVTMNVPHPAAGARSIGKLSDGTLNLKQLQRSSYMLFFQIPALPEFVATAGHAFLLRRAFRQMIPDRAIYTDADIDAYCENACLPGRMRKMMNYYRAMVRSGELQRMEKEGYPPIEIPTLMLWGEADIALGKELTYGTERWVPGLTLRYLPGISHLVQQHAPEAVNGMLSAFLQGRGVPEAAAFGLC
ncbi:MAG: alpha/beta hydrolase [Chrysiogenetes bacterium]|nr:alpha/beta hydrolase [Chrysiogenetes bacterium]